MKLVEESLLAPSDKCIPAIIFDNIKFIEAYYLFMISILESIDW